MINEDRNPKFRNYVPHSKWGEVRKFDGDDAYLENLSRTVTEACNRFFKSRGIETSNQMGNTVLFNEAQKKSAT
jgi:hypothetical protein